MFAVWTAIVWVVTLLRYLNFLVEEYAVMEKLHKYWPSQWRLGCGEVQMSQFKSHLSTAWAVLQTFTFITFTRLFFRSGSNLDPATANKVAWETAKNMVNQIGGAWDNSIIMPFCHEYRTVVWAFVLGMIIHWLPAKWKQAYRLYFARMPLPLMVGVVVMTIVVIYQFVMAEAQPFIYFQF